MLTRRHALGTLLLPAVLPQGFARIQIGDAVLEVRFLPGGLDLPQERILQWIKKAAAAVACYYVRFPVAMARVTVHPAQDRTGVFHGTTWGTDPPTTRIFVGEHTTAEQLDRDWMMTHELVHMAFPDVADEQHWIEEGIATYVEPIARVLIGDLTPASIWGDMMKSMPQGEPEAGDEGLDRTHTWGRTYWGGALFCLVADVRIRQATGNRKGLRDALQAIVHASGTIDHHWPVTKAFAIGDEGTHTRVLGRLYAEMGEQAAPVDLPALWKQLGVASVNGATVFDDRAPLAAVRRGIASDDLIR